MPNSGDYVQVFLRASFEYGFDAVCFSTGNRKKYSLAEEVAEFYRDANITPGIEQELTCCIAYGNDHEYLPDALESIFSQVVMPKSILIGVDNSLGTDPQLESIKTVRTPIPVHFESFNGRNGPFVIMERLFKLAQTEFVAVFDSDDISHPQRFAIQMQTLRRFQLDAVGTSVGHFEEGVNLVNRFTIYPIEPKSMLKLRFFNSSLYPTLLLRKESFNRVGGFDHFSKFGIDSEFMTRLIFGSQFLNIPLPLYYKRSRSNSLTSSDESGFMSRSRSLVLEKTIEKYQLARDKINRKDEIEGFFKNFDCEV